MSAKEKIAKYTSIQKIHSRSLDNEVLKLTKLQNYLELILEEKKNLEKEYWQAVDAINLLKKQGNIDQISFSSSFSQNARKKLLIIVKEQKKVESTVNNQKNVVANCFRDLKAIEKLIENQTTILKEEVSKKAMEEALEAGFRMNEEYWLED